MGSAGAGVCGCGIVEGEGMRLFLILLIAVPLVMFAAVCDALEYVKRRVRG